MKTRNRCHPRSEPQAGEFEAFVPDPLPPGLTWTPALVRALSDADRAVGRLAGEGGRLPNPHLLLRPFIRREAVLSSKIEGTQATLGELAERMKVAFTTAQRAVDKLEELSILTRTSEAKRDRVYCAKAILDILEQPAPPAAWGAGFVGELGSSGSE